MRIQLSNNEVLYATGESRSHRVGQAWENRVSIHDSQGRVLYSAQESMSTGRIVSDWLHEQGCHYDDDSGIWIVPDDSTLGRSDDAVDGPDDATTKPVR